MEGLFIAAGQQRERSLFGRRRASRNGNVQYVQAAIVSKAREFAGRIWGYSAHLQDNRARARIRKHAGGSKVSVAYSLIVREAREDNIRPVGKIGDAVRRICSARRKCRGSSEISVIGCKSITMVDQAPCYP